ncbi:hypothetical protein FACS1894125_0030 [Actinomycetota bacterium]|nr:hypothetical protein FACS1894125_0030 [Actinomycetota bacterium]
MVKKSAEKLFYSVTTTAALTGVHAQTLRHYEKIGLVVPKRTFGGQRRYSKYDIQRLKSVRVLAEQGINLEGIKIILQQQEELNILRRQLNALKEGSVFTFSDSGISVEQYSKMGLRERLRIMRELHRRMRQTPQAILPVQTTRMLEY